MLFTINSYNVWHSTGQFLYLLLILIISLWEGVSPPHFTNEETEPQEHEVSNPGSAVS